MIKDYLDEIRQIPLLSPKEEQELFAKYKSGNLASKNIIINSNLKLVISIAKKYVTTSFPLEDLIQEGNLGLIKAIDKYDPSRGKFSTCASWYIQQAILRAIGDKGRAVRLPAYIIDDITKISKAEKTLSLSLGRIPTVEEIGANLNMKVDKVIEYNTYRNNYQLSLDAKINPEEADSEEKYNFIDSSLTIDGPEKIVLAQDNKETLEMILASLNEQEKTIIILRFGLDGQPRTLEEIGNLFGITKERVRQVENKALRKLRNPIRAKLIKEIFDF